ncbi:MAG: OmpA family protein [Acetobacteraceae bacterium]|nr:OmpA family protein [Acetobacteraceae bacterium]
MSRRQQSLASSESGGHAGTGSGRWLLTYADLITLLMVFFTVLYAVSRLDLARYQALARSLHRSFTITLPGSRIDAGPSEGDPAGGAPPAAPWLPGAEQAPPEAPTLAPPTGEPGGQDAAGKKALEALSQDIASGVGQGGLGDRVAVFYSERGVTISLGAVLFDLGQATLREDGRRVLDELAPYLARVPNPISIEGYTDNLPINTLLFPSNWELSARRATSVVHYLVNQKGMDPTRFVVLGYGEYRPLVPNVNEESRARNRRVDIVLLLHSPQTEERRAILWTPSPPAQQTLGRERALPAVTPP